MATYALGVGRSIDQVRAGLATTTVRGRPRRRRRHSLCAKRRTVVRGVAGVLQSSMRRLVFAGDSQAYTRASSADVDAAAIAELGDPDAASSSSGRAAAHAVAEDGAGWQGCAYLSRTAGDEGRAARTRASALVYYTRVSPRHARLRAGAAPARISPRQRPTPVSAPPLNVAAAPGALRQSMRRLPTARPDQAVQVPWRKPERARCTAREASRDSPAVVLRGRRFCVSVQETDAAADADADVTGAAADAAADADADDDADADADVDDDADAAAVADVEDADVEDDADADDDADLAVADADDDADAAADVDDDADADDDAAVADAEDADADRGAPAASAMAELAGGRGGAQHPWEERPRVDPPGRGADRYPRFKPLFTIKPQTSTPNNTLTLILG
eukprot:scaffold70_cov262-Prasinococcus_capsulatus_cf.AAC.3